MTDAPREPAVRDAAGGWRRRLLDVPDAAVLVGLVALAAVLRLPGLAARGTWDADQANDMANLQAFVSRGVVPLLGPPTSIGNVHHGAFYYWLLAPAALPGGGRDPVAVVTLVALLGIAAVALTWFLARSIGGPGAGLVAGLLAATSATAVSSSTFIWNPNPIPCFAALALAGAWRAWQTRRARWWLVAAVGQCLVQQCHVLGILALPALAALFIADVRRRRAERQALARVGVIALAIIAAGYLPLLLSELQTGFNETRHALAWLADPGASSAPGLLVRLVFVPLRVLAWPLTGLVTNAPVVGLLAVAAVIVVVIWRLRARAPERLAVAWLAGYVAVGAVLLAVFVSSLGTVTPLPNDHYHAFVAPALFSLLGLGAVALWRRDRPGRLLAAAGVAALVAWNVATEPPAVTADGGWPAAEAAGLHLATDAAGEPLAFVGVPEVKPVTAYTYPLALAGGTVGEVPTARRIAVLCDDLFAGVVGAPCGGPAEDAALAAALEAAGRSATPTLIDRFAPASGRTLSIYGIAGP